MNVDMTYVVGLDLAASIRNLWLAALRESRLEITCRLARFAMALKRELLKPEHCWMHAPESRNCLAAAVFAMLQNEDLLSELEYTFLVHRSKAIATIEYAWRVVLFLVIAPTKAPSDDEVIQHWLSPFDVTADSLTSKKVIPLCLF